MVKKLILKFLEIFAYKVLFPLSRWYNSNAFIYSLKSIWLKEKPSIIWLVFGFPLLLCGRLINKVKYFYCQAVVSNYSILIRKHYVDNYAYPKDALFSSVYRNQIISKRGSVEKLFQNKFLVKMVDIVDGDSFLDCGCGTGMNIKEIFSYFPNSKVAGFDLSSNAIDFAKTINRDKNLELFVGSVLDMGIFNKFADKSVDHILFANMFATILCGSIEETVEFRKKILKEVVRIAKKSVIINEHCVGPRKIYIEQKYRAAFYDNYCVYFDDMNEEGNIWLASDLLIFLKNKY